MWLDREAGSKCYVLSAWDLEAIWSEDSDYPRRVPCEDSRFSDGTQLLDVCYLYIRRKIHSKMLSQGTTYAAYMVFKMTDNYYGIYFPVQDATNLPPKVCLQGNEDEGGVADNYRPIPLITQIRNR
ncbi:hypothetical protein TRIUR3_28328 [Triticum urartu]|uniref:DUF1618 domain-containing protein n=1 Tax=Triticum urartu TaxID=4572 RepID=M7ZS34_TRIUA|nr:hypothetical protein TRIUR3_28328 [Triticum urartu]